MKTAHFLIAAATIASLGTLRTAAQTSEKSPAPVEAASETLAPETAAPAAAQDSLRVRITAVKGGKGTLLVALGDYTDPAEMAYAMVPVIGETVECTLRGKIDRAAKLHAFHDANGNYTLDKDAAGIPAEGCASGPLSIAEDGAATVTLKYYKQN
jgi:uncharacterized protein (DUF2141 family)